jgi:PAS domain-containing protein
MLDKIKNILGVRCKTSDTPSLDRLIENMKELQGLATCIYNEVHTERKIWEDKVKRQDIIFRAMIENMPDMVWMKDLEGRYLYANSAIKDGLLFDRNPIGKTDMTLSINAKKRFGSDNHTFGEICGNSDLEVIRTKKSGRFLEDGMVKGKMLYLEVFKTPIIINGELIGVAGSGRDMTEYIEAYRVHNCKGCHKMNDIFTRYEYKNKEH